jgi:hypothetical protein
MGRGTAGGHAIRIRPGSGLGSSHRELEAKGAAPSRSAFNHDPSMVSLHDVLHDGKAKPAPLDVVHRTGPHPVESFEDLGLLIEGDPDSLVFHFDDDQAGTGKQAQKDPPGIA